MISLIQPNGSSLNQKTTPWVKVVTAASFMKEVAEASVHQPVLVDFWAPACAPCRQLTPLLEKLANEAKGQWLLAKINVDENPQIAIQLRIQSLPTVYLFKAGQPVDGFMGLISEQQIRQFLESHLSLAPADEDGLKRFEDAESLWQQGMTENALDLLLPFVQQQPTHAKAIALVIRCFYALGHSDKARQFFSNVPAELQNNPELLPLQTLFQLVESGQRKETLILLEQKKIKNPQDLSVVYDLSLRQFAEGQFIKSMETLMTVIQLNKEWPEARLTLVQMFEAVGINHAIVHQCRRHLSAILFT